MINKINEIRLLEETFIPESERMFRRIENSESVNLDPIHKFTIALWIRTDENHSGAIIAKMEHDLEVYRGWDVCIDSKKKLPRIIFHLINKYPENCIKVATQELSHITDRKWHHIAIVYSGHSKSSGVRVFIDGKQVQTITEFDSLDGNTDNSHPITIGSRLNGVFNFKGSIYDVRIITEKMNQEQIFALINEAKKMKLPQFFSDLETNQNQEILRVKNVSRVFTIHHEKNIDIFSKLISVASGKDTYEKITVLDNISFELKKGEMLGILGRNGSGKTTLLKIIGKIMQPSTGNIEINGKISSFLSLGSAFHPDLTARQNVILYGMILGEIKKNMEEKVEAIIKFAELENFIDVKIRNFSTGMNMRLAFSTALSVDPDILLIDEVLAVGDYSFQQKSLDAFLQIKNSGKSVIFVSHNLDQLERFCDRLILLENGKIIDAGEPEDVINTYVKLMSGYDPKNIDLSNP